MVAEGICDAETVDMEAVLPSLSAASEPSPLLAALVHRGALGARTGQGFLPWDPQDRARAARGLAAHLMAQLPSGASQCGDALVTTERGNTA
jgi:3-hydroxybutyryl-CoA dehydrogenase